VKPIVDFELGIQPQGEGDCRSEVSRGDGRCSGVGSDFVTGAVKGAAANASPGYESGVTERPVFPPGIARSDLGSAAEFAGPNDESLAEQAAGVEVFQQGGCALVGRRHEAVLQAAEVIAVGVPEESPIVGPVDADEGDARFDEPPGE
jgi:hypothetical protein